MATADGDGSEGGILPLAAKAGVAAMKAPIEYPDVGDEVC